MTCPHCSRALDQKVESASAACVCTSAAAAESLKALCAQALDKGVAASTLTSFLERLLSRGDTHASA